MKLILVSNILEHRGFDEFIFSVSQKHPSSIITVTGDLLNVFPEPGEDIRGSICYELYGQLVESGLETLIETRFKNIPSSSLLPMLHEVFYPTGKSFKAAKTVAQSRYKRLFNKIEKSLKYSTSLEPRFLYVPGNMDYPVEAAIELHNRRLIRQLDQEIIELSGVKIGAIGGIPNSTHPFRNVVEISPYEMHTNEYERRLKMLDGVDVLLAHLSPQESPSIDNFLKNSPLKLLICRAPFDFNRSSNFRGALEIIKRHGKPVIMVRPFDYPINNYFILDLPSLEISKHSWSTQKRPDYEIETPSASPIA